MILESVFLKNVILYLQTLSDIINFITINKKCQESINTMFINTYNLSLSTPAGKILKMFPSLQTLYLTRLPPNVGRLNVKSISQIDVSFSDKKMKLTDFFKKSTFPPKIRNLRIYSKSIEWKTPTFKKFTKLVEMSIFLSHNSKDKFNIVVVPSLKKMNLFIPLQRLVDIQDFDFKSSSRVQFNLIVSYKSKSLTPDFSVFERFKGLENVKIYVTFLAPETLNLEFMTHFDFFCNERNKEKLKRLTVFYTLGGKCELIKNTIEKCFYDELLVVTIMKIYMVKGCVKFDECMLEIVKIVNYSGTPLLINSDNLRVITLNRTLRSLLKFSIKGVLCDEVILTDKMIKTDCWFEEKQVFKYLIENGQFTVFKALCACVTITDKVKTFYTRQLEGDLSIIPCTEFNNEGEYFYKT
ncbi:hypothetical protein EIN_233310 [Entamoeba invadens IP1]|uniref:Uncharacterized protein n=1 Tax=Entamoeba invadens IP1 TaxID=370355 RepID=A0A0A1U570_ENTIV|nr:hypothetical protein EIN_233310 [Entamoeba invadens IP1]ELP89360.1 hypothetical protein EIN_233310 [Entamoeba invadens IP1]|eukprot:XP_004256131.1 hypothetical protein EIN_233310 [Entamoeba invadens IP1]